MKHLYLFSVLLLLSVTQRSNAQNDIKKYLTSVDIYSGEESNPKFKSTYTFNQDFSLKKRDYEEVLDGTTQLSETQYDDYVYDNQNIINLNVFERDSPSSDFVNTKIHTYTHDTEGRIETEEIKSWDPETSVFVNDWRYTYSYSNTGLLRKINIEYANANDTNWKNILIKIFNYNSDGKYTEYIRQEHPSIGNTIFEKHVFSYKNNGNLEKIENYYRRGNQLKLERIIDVTTDSNGNITEMLKKDLSQGTWKNSFKTEYNYDNQTAYAETYVAPYELQFLEYLAIYAKNAISSYTGYIWKSDSWEKGLTNKFNYTDKSDMSVIDSKLLSKKLIIAPNPVKDILKLSSCSLSKSNYFEIYNIAGQLVMKGGIINNKINVKNISKGIYFLKVKSNGTQIIKEFIKD